MKRSFPYIAPATDTQLVFTDGETMKEAVDAFRQKDYVRSLHLLIDAMDFDFRDRFGNAEGTSFLIPHGSIVVKIEITSDMLHISADFLKLPEKGRVAMLRQVAEMNLNRLMLARFVKSGDCLKMEYSCALTDTHPHKIWSVLCNICAIGDKYDDEFCTQFNAERCYEPKITYYPQEAVDKVYNDLQLIGGLTLAAVNEYNSQRKYIYSWTILSAALYQFAYFSNIQGQLANDLETVLGRMNDQRPMEDLVIRGSDFIEKLLTTPKEELAKHLYSVEMMVSLKRTVTLQSVQEHFEELHESTAEALQQRDYDQVVSRITYMFYQLLQECNSPLTLEYVIVTALREAGDCPMDEAAHKLWIILDHIMDGDLTDGDEEDETSDEND